MPMRGSTLCLIAFSAVMGMASVGLTSAHPHDETDIEIALTAPEVAEQAVPQTALEVAIEDAVMESVRSEGLDIEIEVTELQSDIAASQETMPADSLEEAINQRLRDSARADRKNRAERFDRPDRAERQERGERRNRDGRVRDWPYFGETDKPEVEPNEAGAPEEVALESAITEKAQGKTKEKSKENDALDMSSGTVTNLTIPTLTMDDLSSSFEQRMQKHILRFAESLGAARAKNEDRFAYFDDGLDIESPEDMRQVARLAEEVIAESGVISNVADFAADIIEDIKIESSGDGFTIDFEGKRLGKLTRSAGSGVEHFNIEGLGSLMTLNRSEIIGEDGKPRTRITLDIDETGSTAGQ